MMIGLLTHHEVTRWSSFDEVLHQGQVVAFPSILCCQSKGIVGKAEFYE